MFNSETAILICRVVGWGSFPTRIEIFFTTYRIAPTSSIVGIRDSFPRKDLAGICS
jgi:hypothetical protein